MTVTVLGGDGVVLKVLFEVVVVKKEIMRRRKVVAWRSAEVLYMMKPGLK